MASNSGRPSGRTLHRSVDRMQDKENKRKPSMSDSASPYSAQYRTNVTHDQRVLIGQRNHVTKLHRLDLEDRYLSLLDEHFALKKENLANHDNIRKLITKLMRLSSSSGGCGGESMSSNSRLNSATSKQNLSNDEDLHLRILDLESYNAQLRERLNSLIRFNNSNRSRCSSSVATFRGSSSSSLSKNANKLFHQSQDNVSRVMIHEPPSRQSRTLVDQSKSNISIQNATSNQKHRDDVATSDDPIALELQVQEEEIAELKAIIEQLKSELSSKSLDSSNNSTLQSSSSLQAEVDEITARLNRREDELMGREKKLRTEMQKLKSVHKKELEEKSIKMDDLTAILDREIARNKTLFMEKQHLEVELSNVVRNSQVTEDVLAENRLLKTHRDNISSLANELAARTERMDIQRREIADLRTKLDAANNDLSTLQLCQAELLLKIQGLQDANDELSVSVEGLRAQCECMRESNEQLQVENQQLRTLR